MTRQSLGKAALFLGVLAFLSYLLHDIIGGLLYPGYSWMTQAVSDLTSVTSPSRNVARVFTRIYGVSSILSSLLVLLLEKNERRLLKGGLGLFLLMNLTSTLGYSLFPLTEAGSPTGFQNVMHIVVTVLVVLLSVFSLLVLFIGFRKKEEKAFALSSLAILLLMMAGAIGSGAVPKAVFGIVERFSTYAAVLYTLVLGLYGWKLSEE